MIAQVDAKLKREAIDFEAENQQMSDFIEEKDSCIAPIRYYGLC